jgi:flagellin
MRINHNIAALNTYRQLGTANNAMGNSMEKLSSGLRINRAGDDAAGLAISEKMRAQVRGLDQAQSNAQDGISLIQTAEGALNETHSILQRMRELAVQAGNDTNTTEDRGEIQKEINQLTSEINRIGNTTEFNTQKLLNGGKDSDTAAKLEGSDVSAILDDNLTTSTLSLSINGEAVTLSNVSGLDGSTTAFSMDDLATALDSDLDAVFNGTSFSGVEFDVEVNGDSLVITSDNADIDLTASTATATLGLTTDNSTDATAKQGAALQFQIGANENQSLSLEISDMRADALGLTGAAGTTGFTTNAEVTNGTDATGVEAALDVSTHENAAKAVTAIQKAIDDVSAERSKLGATQNRLDHTINNLGTSSENLTAAESRIRDVDMAKEMMNQTKNSILAQASQAMLAQANQQPQGVLQLLR